MVKFKDLTVGSVCDIVCVVSEATARETKAKKPYLSLKLFDGSQTINANYWDWSGVSIPERNLVVNIKGQVTEYLGELQLNVKTITTNTDVPLTEFAPSSGYSINDVYLSAYEMAGRIQDNYLRELTVGLLEELRDKWMTVPGAKAVHHNYVAGTLIHSLSVARIANSMAEHIDGANVDLCTAGALLHDVGKLFAYHLNGVIIEMTDEGMAYEHAFIGAELVGNYSENLIMEPEDSHKLFLLRHIILSHHGSLEHGAVVTPQCIEAYIVHHADVTDAAAEQIRVASAKLAPGALWTERVWALNNRPQMSSRFVAMLFETCGLE